MKVLTVRQPMAWAIAVGYKPEENRSRQTTHRGQLGIHAGRWDRDYAEVVKQLLVDLGVLKTVDQEVTLRRDLLVPHAVIAVTDLHAVCPIEQSPRCRCSAWAGIGQCHWRLRNTVPLDVPIPAKGALNLWSMDLPGHGSVVPR